MEVSEEKARLLSYYDAEFTRRFGAVVHPYTRKPIESVQEYLDALESQETHRCIITKNKLTLDELQDIFAEKFKTYRKPRSGGNICGISDYLDAMEEQRQLGVIRQAQKRQDELVEQTQHKQRAEELEKKAQKMEEQKIAELREQEKKFKREQSSEKARGVLLAVAGAVVGFVVWLVATYAFSFVFGILAQIPILSSILFWPSDINLVSAATINIGSVMVAGVLVEKIGKTLGCRIFGGTLLALIAIVFLFLLECGTLETSEIVACVETVIAAGMLIFSK